MRSNRFVIPFGILFLLASHHLQSQELLLKESSTTIQYIYRNKLRIEWPLDFSAWRSVNYFRVMEETEQFLPFILQHVGLIKDASIKDGPLDIQIFDFYSLRKIQISPSKDPVAHLFQGDLLIFQGKHKMEIITKNYMPIRIYFDDPQDLALLQSLSIAEIRKILTEELLDKKKTSSSDLYYSHQIIYIQPYQEVVRSGFIKHRREHNLNFGTAWGAGVWDGYLALSGLMELFLSRRHIHINGLARESRKFGLQSTLSIMQNYAAFTYGISLLNNMAGLKQAYKFGGLGFGYTTQAFVGVPNTRIEDGLYVRVIAEVPTVVAMLDINAPFRRESLIGWRGFAFNLLFKF